MPGSPFQQSVWQALQAVPYGSTASYGEQAQKLGTPQSVRAVAGTNGANRVAIDGPLSRPVDAARIAHGVLKQRFKCSTADCLKQVCSSRTHYINGKVSDRYRPIRILRKTEPRQFCDRHRGGDADRVVSAGRRPPTFMWITAMDPDIQTMLRRYREREIDLHQLRM
ncbi:methylated-DNA--[protein]-cysteine S-methyltransferase [Burkholderia sp. Se-20373]|uniref:methylated-DNA--[protein]-cysteine S-methyltransferase n=1 Tax=Burkholderia sp. Se-20373 TaxID=2703898 RepID=UPI001F11C25E|nr:methylated-DNA--[protein]-cysteine S-methyltransferase [Burkholderia sp. Se-20373]